MWTGFALWVLLQPSAVMAQSVTVGQGSYSTSLPPGAVGPKDFSGASVAPKVSGAFALPAQTNDFWSSLIFPFFRDPHSNVMYAHPVNARARDSGLQIGYTTEHVFAAQDYLYPFAHQLTVGITGLTAAQTVTDAYGDWTVSALWEQGDKSLRATLGHGLPFVFFEAEGGDALVTLAATPNIWYDQDGVVGLTVQGRHFGLFAPSGSTWSYDGRLQSSLDGKDYFSVALLPDASPSTLELFRSHAYAFVTDSVVDWTYDESNATLTSAFRYETTLKEGTVNETLTALYRHQWLNTPDVTTGLTYESPRGEMRLLEGNVFTTDLAFSGIVPALPDRGDYNPETLLGFVRDAASETLDAGPTYENGKAMGRFAQLVHIADQIGATAERDYFLAQIKVRLEEWFTVGGDSEYSYNDSWDVLTGYPSGFGADDQINDHHFHASYAVMSAATVAQYDPTWAAQENWGGMVNLLIRDANNWDRSDPQFPFLRSHDAYAGHSWAAGHGDFGDGNNQESSSESLNFATAAFLWGAVTGQREIRDLGIFLHTTETSAVEQYWFDVDNAVFPETYPHVAIGMVWGGKGVHSTWFGADPEFIHGINILPVTSGSLYLGRHPEHVTANYDEIVSERSGQPIIWQDVLWQYLATADPARALSHYYADVNYAPFDGESRAHTLHWLYNLKKMGRMDTSIQADIPSYTVFTTSAGEKTYVAYNPETESRVVAFTDGYSMTVAPGAMASETTSQENPDAPVALLIADRTSGKSPLTVAFLGGNSFDRNGEQLVFAWDFGGLGSSSASDTTYTFTEIGAHQVTLTVTNERQLVARDSVIVTVLGNGTPFSGSPKMVPGRIEAENFDIGGEGVAYHDTEAGNIGLAYRPSEGVDIEGASDGGFDVYWITAGEWIEYTFEVAESGTYEFTPYVSTVPGFGNFRMLIDNVDVSGKRAVTGTGGWQNWRGLPVRDVVLEAGVHILRFDFDSDSDKQGWLFSLNYIRVSRTSSVGTEGEDPVPSEFALSENYPNPFNPTTQIEYSLPAEGLVSLTVYNVLGQEVQSLVRGRQSAGLHSVRLDASDLPGGVYFYRAEFGGLVETKSMILLK